MFTKAITKKPCRALIDGITTAMFDDGTPDYELAAKQHDNYVAVLRSLGLEVLDLDADERYPDSCFVEDPAVVTAEFAIITNPATDSRNGEKYEIIDAIKKFYSDDQIFHIEAPGTMEGGDVMLVDKHFFVGQSDRTNAEGFKQFEAIVSKFGYTAEAVPVTEGLHLKDFVIYLENNNMLVSAKMNEEPAFKDYNRFVIDADELYAINSMNINGTVLVPEGFPKTLKIIQDLGYPTILVNNSEFSKIDGSLTCLSLRF
ncbi:MAG: arginine deiminase-related protein [Bacillota bacterium]|nr:arginine deiminase-related protein [Bacillota bacterium]